MSSPAKAAYISDPAPNYANQALAPNLIYLEIRTPSTSALMVRGYVDVPQAAVDAPVETWFSSQREVLRTQAGFLVTSQGIAQLWTSTRIEYDAQGQAVAWVYDAANKGLYNIAQTVQQVPAEQNKPPASELLRRAQKLPTLQLHAYQSKNLNAPQTALMHWVGIDTRTGDAVYGRHCPQTDYCIEYLRRTASDNL